jgi:hypothetical protein
VRLIVGRQSRSRIYVAGAPLGTKLRTPMLLKISTRN